MDSKTYNLDDADSLVYPILQLLGDGIAEF